MPKRLVHSLAWLLLLMGQALAAQSIIAIPPRQCVWHAGDDPRWSAPSFVDSAWQPYSTWRIDGRQPRIWIRCHADISPLGDLTHPALEIRYGRAFQLFLDGALIGSAGNIVHGYYTENAAPIFSVPPPQTRPQQGTIALRITYRSFEESTPVVLTGGDQETLREQLEARGLHESHLYLPIGVLSVVVAVAGFMLLAMYLNDRSRPELLLLAAFCWCLFLIRSTEYCTRAQIAVPWAVVTGIMAVGQMAYFLGYWFVFRLAGKRVPRLFWLVMVVEPLHTLALALTIIFPPELSLRATSLIYVSLLPVILGASWIGWLVAPLMAFWPWARIPKRMRGLAACCMFWGLFEATWLTFVALGSAGSIESVNAQRWALALMLMRELISLVIVITLVALLFRDQRRIAEDRAQLSGEMHAAQQIQQMLVQPRVKSIPGLRIDVAFRPMREVGGDFYLCRILPGERQRVILGDVSGKGAAAAMTAALLLGAAGRRDDDSPAELLSHMNLVLCDARVSGFATCLCADITRDGSMIIANAGHLSPWRREEELTLDPGLPLGVDPDVEYSQTALALRPGDTVTFVSDGVVEARNAQGEIFGFDRAELISGLSAETIADAAQRFGQEDDITVLQLWFGSAGVLEA